MDSRAHTISRELYKIDMELKDLRSRMRDLREARAALVDTITGIIGTDTISEFEVQDGSVTATPKRLVSFPTKDNDPEKQLELISIIKSANQWDRFSVLNYAVLKSAWLSNQPHDHSWRQEITPFAIESTELKISVRNRSRYRPPDSGAERS